MSADSEAYALSLLASPELTDAERVYALMVARHESFYGRATTPAAWVGSHNWGAVQGNGPAGSFSTTDLHADGSKYVGKFKRYNSDLEGWKDLVRILLKQNVRTALATGDARAACAAQRSNGYFEAPLELYIAALERNYRAWQTAMGKEGPLRFPPLVPPGVGSSYSPSDTTPFTIRAVVNLPTLRQGSYGNTVQALCALLKVALTPKFDARVASAVKEYQRTHGLIVDGIVGGDTWTELLKGYA